MQNLNNLCIPLGLLNAMAKYLQEIISKIPNTYWIIILNSRSETEILDCRDVGCKQVLVISPCQCKPLIKLGLL